MFADFGSIVLLMVKNKFDPMLKLKKLDVLFEKYEVKHDEWVKFIVQQVDVPDWEHDLLKF